MTGMKDDATQSARSTDHVVGAALGWSALGFPLAVHSVHHAVGNRVPLLSFYGFALMGGVVLLIAAVIAARDRDVFHTTAFAIYGLFWLNQAVFSVLVMTRQIVFQDTDVNQAWMWLAVAIFSCLMVFPSARISAMTFITFVGIAGTTILLAAGFFLNDMPGQGLVSAGGVIGIVAGLLAWYIGAAEVAHGVGASWSLPLGRRLT